MNPAWPKLMIPVVPTFSWIPSAKTPYVVASTPTLIQKSPSSRNVERDARGAGAVIGRRPAASEEALRADEQDEISIAKPTATFTLGSITSVDHSCTRPISSPPASAP